MMLKFKKLSDFEKGQLVAYNDSYQIELLAEN